MSEKKAGSRDISELKARLGLKKGGAAPAGKGNGERPSSGVIAPPGLVPQRPVIPNAHDDPFAAMNVMAAAATVQKAQEKEIIVVREGEHVEHVGEKSTGALALKLAVPAIAGLVVGIAIAKIGSSASYYNEGLRGAKSLLGDKNTPSTVTSLKKALADLDTLLDEAKTKNNFKPNADLDKKLKDLATRLEVKSDIVFRAKQGSLDADLSGQILSFYAGVIEAKDMIDVHNKAAIGDDILLKKGKAAADAAEIKDGPLAGQMRYAVLVSAPTESEKTDFGAKLVEIAGYYCGGNSPQPKCPEGESPTAYAYRNDPGSTPIKGDVVTQGSDSVPAKKILLLLPNGIRDSLIKGGEPTVSEYYYARRLRALYDRVHGKPGQDGKAAGGLLEEGNKVETRLTTEAGRGTRFSFFM